MPIMKSSKHQMCYADTFTTARAHQFRRRCTLCAIHSLGAFTNCAQFIYVYNTYIYKFIYIFLIPIAQMFTASTGNGNGNENGNEKKKKKKTKKVK